MDWLEMIMRVITNPAVIEPIMVAVIGYGVRAFQGSKRYQLILDLTSDVVDYIEEHYKEWNIHGSQKMDRFIQVFTQEFKKQVGRLPTQMELETAKLRAEARVQRARRMTLAEQKTKKGE